MIFERNLFDRFGGVRPMAEAMLEPPSTVQSWKTSGRIPAAKQPGVLLKAEELGLDVQALDVIFPLRLRADEVALEGRAAEVAFDRGAGMKRAAEA